jgi:hypothetical protein
MHSHLEEFLINSIRERHQRSRHQKLIGLHAFVDQRMNLYLPELM